MGSDIFGMIFYTILVLGGLIFVHELGHHLAAKISGIRVERFSIGYPPRAFGFKWGETDYCISWVPLGGYCKMAGMIDESLDPDGVKGEPWEFMSKPIPIKMFTLFAGPFANFVVAIFLFSSAAFFYGEPSYDADGNPIFDEANRIGAVMPEEPAFEAGLIPGDEVISIDDVQINKWDDMRGLIYNRPEETAVFGIKRGDDLFTKEITIAAKPDEEGNIRGAIGILPDLVYERADLISSIERGFSDTYNFGVLMLVTIKKLVAGQESMKNLGGPIIIAQYTNDYRKAGGRNFIIFIAFLSLNLGLLNLLPMPVLDGGHLVILSLEGIFRKELPLKAKMVIQQIGMAILLVLIVVVFYNDIMRVAS
ncbi:MAG: RIP metalloprotease RseP [bacterium]|nr:RIP metalloprotease RseP [bacterium]